jgi:hypothetical protein
MVATPAPDLTPSTVAVANARLVLDALAQVGAHPFWIPDTGRRIRFGVTRPECDAFVNHLATERAGEPIYVEREGGTAAAEDLEDLPDGDVLRVYRAYRIPHAPRTVRASAACVLEVWEPVGDGTHEAPVANHYARVLDIGPDRQVPADHPELGPVMTLPVFTRPIPSDRRFPIDVVLMWVDDADPEWRRRRTAALEALSGTAGVGPGEDEDGRAPTVPDQHFRQHDELRYALRSIDYFAPWVNRVYLVTDRQRPSWVEDSALTIVDHQELLREGEADALFNSHAISALLHRIPGLSEHYVVWNDDIFLGRMTAKHDFFEGNGNPYFFNSRSTMPELESGAVDEFPHQAARRRSMSLVRERFGVEPRQLFRHVPIPQSRSLNEALEADYPDVVATTLSHPFRSVEDHEPIWLHNYMGYFLGRTTPGPSHQYAYVALGADDAPDRLRELLVSRQAHVICINDVGGDDLGADERARVLTSFLEGYFPVPSRFERAADETPLPRPSV